MNELILHKAHLPDPRAGRAAYTSALMDAQERLSSAEAAHQIELEQTERTRDRALEELGALSLRMEQDKQARAE